MKKYFWLPLFLVLSACSTPRAWYHDSVENWRSEAAPKTAPSYSLFLVGDAGEAETDDPVMSMLRAQIKASGENSAVVYLGDNLYPRGLREKDHPNRADDERHLKAQVDAAREAGKMIFVPGNHDWAQGRPEGLDNVKRARKFVRKYAKEKKAWLPPKGCPGPEEIDLNDEIVLIVIDTQWWLHRYEKPDHQFDCEVKYNADFIEMLHNAIERNKHKKVIVTGHHPLFSYGAHGGHFPASTHLFPGKMVNKNLLIPLPIIGTIPVLFRKVWGNIQDIPHPEYQELKRQLTEIFEHYPNLIYAAGHDHNLQYFPVEDQHYIVSGAGSKIRYVAHGRRARFTYAKTGFTRLDYHENGDVWMRMYVTGPGEEPEEIFRQMLFSQPAQPAEVVYTGPVKDYRDSVKVVMGDSRYERGGLFRAFFGNNYRAEWATPIEVPYLDIWNKGFKIAKRGGGHQTKSMRLVDENGKHWVLRSVRKYPELATPEVLRGTFAGEIVQDQISASHPYTAVTIPKLAEAAGVYHTNPKLVWLPADPRLGNYADFGGAMYLFEERPAGDRSDIESFGRSKEIISTLALVEEMQEDNHVRVDGKACLRARMFDMWIGDWDRHDDQWRWAKFDYPGEGDADIYRPIPRDRDVPYFRPEGFMSFIALRKWALRAVFEFDPLIRDVPGYGFAARYWDRYFLTEMTREDYIEIAKQMQERLTDAIIDDALHAWPEEIYNVSGDQIGSFLKSRRDHMVEYAEEYYEFVTKNVNVLGSDREEVFEVNRLDGGDTRVRVWNRNASRRKGFKFYDRTFKKGETKEIRLYGFDGDDDFKIDGEANKGIKVRVIMGRGDDDIEDKSKVKGMCKKTLVYDRKGKDSDIEGGPETRKMLSKSKDVYEYNRREFQFNQTAPLVTGGFNIDDGIYIGGGVHFRKYGFRKEPYKLDEKIQGAVAFGTGAFNFSFKGHYPKAICGWDFNAEVDLRAPNYTRNYYDQGNETVLLNENDITYHRVRLNQYRVSPGLRKSLMHDKMGLTIAAVAEFTQVERTAGRFITDVLEASLDSINGFDARFYAGGQVGIDVDTRDNAAWTTRGVHFKANAGAYAGLNDNSGNYADLSSELGLYIRFRIPLESVLALRVGGGHNIGDFPFFNSQFLGGTSNLRGYRKDRFAGRSSFFQNSELRIKIADFKSVIFPGKFGLVGINDIGKVFADGQASPTLHWGYGGGIWLTPFNAAALTITYTGSKDGWYPYVTLGWKF